MKMRYYIFSIFMILIFSCGKKNPTETQEKVDYVKISEIRCDKLTIYPQDTVQLECIVTASDSLIYRWNGITNIIENQGNSVKWIPESSDFYYIEVLAYIKAGVGTGESKCYYEYNRNGTLRSTTCFYDSEQGKTWDRGDTGIWVGKHYNFEWTFQADEDDVGINSCPAIGLDGTIFLCSLDGYLYAVNPDGTEKWYYPVAYYNDPFYYSSPAIGSDGTIYIGGSNHTLFAINPDGTKKWECQLSDESFGFNSSPAIGSDSTIYIGSIDHNLYAVNPDGTKKWRYQTGGSISSSPAIGADGTIYIGSDHLYAIHPDGTKKWDYDTDTVLKNYSSPAIGSDGIIYIQCGNLYAMNPNGTKKWEYVIDDVSYSSPTIGSEEIINISVSDGSVHAINSDGSLKWKCQTDAHFTSSPAIDEEGYIYIGSYSLDDNGTFYMISPDGNIQQTFPLIGSVNFSPVISPDGFIYLGTNQYRLFAFDI